jgi:hypothetical protein
MSTYIYHYCWYSTIRYLCLCRRVMIQAHRMRNAHTKHQPSICSKNEVRKTSKVDVRKTSDGRGYCKVKVNAHANTEVHIKNQYY